MTHVAGPLHSRKTSRNSARRDAAGIEASLLEEIIYPLLAHGSRPGPRRLERLHRLIAEATHDSLLLLLYETLHTQGRSGLDVRLQEVFGQESAPSETNKQHQTIVTAIKSGNPDRAEEAMRAHLTQVRAKLFGLR